MSPLMTIAASLAGGTALVFTGWRMELASVRAARAAESDSTDEEQEADDAVQAADL